MLSGNSKCHFLTIFDFIHCLEYARLIWRVFLKKKCCHLLFVMTRRWNHSRRVKICLSSHIFSKWCSNFNCFVVFSLLNQWASVFEFTAAKSPDRVLGTSLNYLCVALISHGILNYILDWTEALYFVARCLSALGLNFRASNFAGISQSFRLELKSWNFCEWIMGNPNEVNDPSSTNPPSSPMLDRSMTYSFNKSWIAMGLTFFLVIVPLIGRGSTNFSKDNYFMILGDFLAQF